MKTFRRRFRAALLMTTAASVLVFAAGTRAQNQNSRDQNPQDQNSNADQHASDNAWPYARTGKSPVLAVVGDVACEPDQDFAQGESGHETCDTPKTPYISTTSTPPGPPFSLWQSQEATANQIENMKPDAVALLGDLQYQVGEYQDFEHSYDLTYGAFKMITRPAPGNHEFYDEHGETGVAGYGYFSYFNGLQIDGSGAPVTTTLADPCPPLMKGCGYPGLSAPVAQPVPRQNGQAGHFEASGGVGETVPAGGPVGVGDGWYSYNLGSWHLISLNIECETQPGGCSDSPGTWFAEETEWLKKDLAADHSACTLAYWHQPTYSAADSLTEEGITAGIWWQRGWSRSGAEWTRPPLCPLRPD
jgi:acid phosphatase type 7